MLRNRSNKRAYNILKMHTKPSDKKMMIIIILGGQQPTNEKVDHILQ